LKAFDIGRETLADETINPVSSVQKICWSI